jgi:enterochelin esterase-like enzyme
VKHDTLRSRFVNRTVGYAIARRPGAVSAMPVVICLPGRGATGVDWLESLRLGDVAAQLGGRFAVVAVDGGESYWHRRSSGEDRLAMLLRELVPMLANRGLGREPAARTIAGWSMGGYGALLAAGRAPETFAAVSVVSPALWTSAGDTAAGAFDDAEDYRRNDVFANLDVFRRVPLRIECGTGDPFIGAARTLAGRVPEAATNFASGCHDAGYWRGVAPKQLDWLAAHTRIADRA